MNSTDKNGQKQKFWTHKYPDGQPWRIGYYKNNNAVGLWQTFHSHRRLSSIGHYDNGKQIGLWNFYDGQKKMIKTVLYI